MEYFWLMVIGIPCALWALFALELYFITRITRKKSVLHEIREGLLERPHYSLKGKADLYGTGIEIAIEGNSIYFINGGKALCLDIKDLKSITQKNDKYIFKTKYYIKLWKTTIFAISCTDKKLTERLQALAKSINNTYEPLFDFQMFKIVSAIIAIVIFIALLVNTTSTNDSCKSCGGKGYFGADGYLPYVDCPDC